MLTDPARKLKTDPGDPDICPLHADPQARSRPRRTIAECDAAAAPPSAAAWRTRSKLVEDLVAYLRAVPARRAELAADPGYAWEVLAGRRPRA